MILGSSTFLGLAVSDRSISIAEVVCDTMERTSLPARRPSAGAVPGRCVACLAAVTHRPLFLGLSSVFPR